MVGSLGMLRSYGALTKLCLYFLQIKEQMKEVKAGAGIEVYTLHLQCNRDLLWDRISSRLEAEPHRFKYNEHERSWCVLASYPLSSLSRLTLSSFTHSLLSPMLTYNTKIKGL